VSRARVVAACIVLTSGLCSWLYTHWQLPWPLHTGDAKEYAVMARRLADGEGFTTAVVYPAELRFGADAEHPAVMRPPLWPLVLAAGFKLTGARTGTVHVAVLFCHLIAVGAAAALAWHLAGPLVGTLAGITTAATPQLAALTFDGLSEPLFAACVAAAFLLAAWKSPPFAVGAVCRLAYLTRYNGAVLVPVLLLPVLAGRRILPNVFAYGMGVLVVVLPWWIRNWVVTGDPFYSLLSLNLHFSTIQPTPRASLYYMIDPDFGSAAAMDPLDKLGTNLAKLVRHWPLAAVNFVACLGVTLGCLRKDRLSIAFALVAVATTLGIALALPNGRYFVPFTPVLVALGASGWARYGGRLAVPMLALLVATPILPGIVPDLHDVALMRRARAIFREQAATGTFAENAARAKLVASCLHGRPLVVSSGAADLAWNADVVAIYQPSRAPDFWRIVDTYPVRFVQSRDVQPLDPRRFEQTFRPRSDCGAGLYERR
jgi:4-amino-4-deoxy-L-arabinose transferase-like glycosyltransferase